MGSTLEWWAGPYGEGLSLGPFETKEEIINEGVVAFESEPFQIALVRRTSLIETMMLIEPTNVPPDAQ
jgi:hypothetical protein